MGLIAANKRVVIFCKIVLYTWTVAYSPCGVYYFSNFIVTFKCRCLEYEKLLKLLYIDEYKIKMI